MYIFPNIPKRTNWPRSSAFIEIVLVKKKDLAIWNVLENWNIDKTILGICPGSILFFGIL